MSEEVFGFEVGQIQGALAELPGSYLLDLSDPARTSARLGSWEVEMIELGNGQRRFIVWQDSVERIHVEGPAGVTVRLLP